MRKIKDKINNVWTGLMFGLKNTENEVFTQLGSSHDNMISVNQEVGSHRVSKALLKGELTQEVKELRYRTYTVDREAKHYEYFSPTLAKKMDEKYESKFVKFENSENLNVITIQPNERNIEGVNDGLKDAFYKDEHLIYVEPKKSYTLNVKRNFFPRYKIEEFTKKLVVFEKDPGKTVKLDFYVSIYPDDKVFISKGFVREVENIRDKGIKSDILDIISVAFTTLHAYKLNDMIQFEFNNLSFEKVLEFDGDYILRFSADIVINGEDMIKRFYNKEMADKYANHERKERVLDLTDNFAEKYVCERCGKEVYYDPSSIDDLNPTQGKDIDDDSDDVSDSETTEYMDMQIAEQTYGKLLCRDCLRKYLKEQAEIESLK